MNAPSTPARDAGAPRVNRDEFGDRMKLYEGLSNTPLLPGVPVCARLDGRNFHTFTKHAARPFSEAFHAMMVAVTRHLVVESCATVGYTQSDEISLAWVDHPFFEGNPQKMCSTLAAMASVTLAKHSLVVTGFARERPESPCFPCRRGTSRAAASCGAQS